MKSRQAAGGLQNMKTVLAKAFMCMWVFVSTCVSECVAAFVFDLPCTTIFGILLIKPLT